MRRKHIYIVVFCLLAAGGFLLALPSSDGPKTEDARAAAEDARHRGAEVDEERASAKTPAEEPAPEFDEPQGLPLGPGTADGETAPTGRRLAGWVTDSNGEPVVDAVLSVQHGESIVATRLSDEEGRFEFSGISENALRITADGGALGYTSVAIVPRTDIDSVQLTLEAIGWIQAVVSVPRELKGDASTFQVQIDSQAAELVEQSAFGQDDQHSGRQHEAEDGDGDTIAPVAVGTIGARIAVKAGLTYAVNLREVDVPGDGREIEEFGFDYTDCGQVRVLAGETATVDCTPVPRDAVVVGRVVATSGKGVGNIKVILNFEGETPKHEGEPWGRSAIEATTDAYGAFELRVNRRRPTVADLSTVAVRGYATAQRRQVGLRPGSRTDIGDVLVLRDDEVPIGWLEEDFGGIGGLVSLTERGVFLIDVEADCPLRAVGVEPGDVITRIDGLDAAELAMPEILKRLRGEVGTSVSIAVRNPMGETWDLDVTRGVIRAASTNWPSGGREADEAPPVYDFEALDIDGLLPPE